MEERTRKDCLCVQIHARVRIHVSFDRYLKIKPTFLYIRNEVSIVICQTTSHELCVVWQGCWTGAEYMEMHQMWLQQCRDDGGVLSSR